VTIVFRLVKLLTREADESAVSFDHFIHPFAAVSLSVHWL